jgi:general secretion pathway protein B
MSYILDALRRAESERGRGEVPGLHAQAVPVSLGEGRASHSLLRGGRLAAVAGAAVLLLGGLVWWWSVRTPASAVAAPQASESVVGTTRPVDTPPSPSTSPAPAAEPPAPPLLVAPRVAPSPPPAALPPAALPPAPPPANMPAPVMPAPQPAPVAAAPAPAPTTATPPPTSGPAAANKPTLLSDLAQAQRAELPQMQIGGSIYSDQPASRFVVVNGLVVREGETAAPGVTLERIGPKSAVIRWREMRIELPL